MLYLVGEMVFLIVAAFGLGYVVAWLIHADRSSSSKNVRLDELDDESARMRTRAERAEEDLAEARRELIDLRREHDRAIDDALITAAGNDYVEVRAGADDARRVEVDNGRR